MCDNGFSQQEWDNAKREAREVLINTAIRKSVISYSALVARIQAIEIGAHDPRLADLLAQISEDEDEQVRGMLSVVVVHQHGDMMPGQGFFNLAGELGRDITDHNECWVTELNNIYATWSHGRG